MLLGFMGCQLDEPLWLVEISIDERRSFEISLAVWIAIDSVASVVFIAGIGFLVADLSCVSLVRRRIKNGELDSGQLRNLRSVRFAPTVMKSRSL